MKISPEFMRSYPERTQYPSVAARGLAWGIDIVVSSVLAFVVWCVVLVFSDTLAEILFLPVIVGYFIILEARLGWTVGKRLVGLRVVDMNGEPISTYSATVRNATKILGAPSLLLILVGVVLIADSRYDQRLGDRLAKTLVVES